MKRSNISWADYSGGDLNFICGCTKVSEGCRFCWAEAIYERFGRDFSAVHFYPEKVEKLLRARWPQDGNVRGPHSKPLCFVCDTGDLFHPDVPADFIIQAFEVMAARRDVDWVVLTKRPERMVSVLFGQEGNFYLGGGDYYPNVILGVTAENQDMADERIPWLVNNWEGPRLVCVEPMLEPVSLGDMADKVSWVICGGESGTHRRPFDKLWASELYAECRDAGVPFYFKQGSALRPGQDDLLGIHQVRVREWPR